MSSTPQHHKEFMAQLQGDTGAALETASAFPVPPEALPEDVTPEEIGWVDPELAHLLRVGQAPARPR